MSPWAIDRFSREVARGAVFGYPTDTVWGFGCHPLIAYAVARILQIKNRDPARGLILLCSGLEFLDGYIDDGAAGLDALRAPGERPTTWLVPAGEACPVWIRGKFESVAIRITDHPLVSQLCDRLRAPIVSTSANRAGRSTARNALQMRRQFGAELDRIVGGFSASHGRASEIRTLSGAVLRSGD